VTLFATGISAFTAWGTTVSALAMVIEAMKGRIKADLHM
jgi:hypothetical protein